MVRVGRGRAVRARVRSRRAILLIVADAGGAFAEQSLDVALACLSLA